jgi:A/G-specific adenine glycosylase
VSVIPHVQGADPRAVAGPLLSWYDRHRRVLPWRARPGERQDPYRVWLSEIMLQQTTVAAAGSYFRAFLDRWPTVGDLAAADLDSVLAMWAGLGYYARARNLHRCAREVAERFGGRFPDDEAALLELPGVGPYTAAAIAAIAFDRKATAVDGNVERVVARLTALTAPMPGAKAELRRRAAAFVPDARCGDYAQALMDLGATVCTPRKPKCILCPLSGACAARALGIAEDLPAKAAKAPKPLRAGLAFWTLNPAGDVLLRRRPETGLLGGMMEVPSSPWTAGPQDDPLRHAPVAADWRRLPGAVRHVFTHFELRLEVAAARAGGGWREADGIWVPLDRLSDQALPTVMRKVVRHALAHV